MYLVTEDVNINLSPVLKRLKEKQHAEIYLGYLFNSSLPLSPATQALRH